MRRFLAYSLVLAMVAAACSSDGSGEDAEPADVTSTVVDEPSDTTTSAAPSPSTGTLISAADGGVVSFGDDVTLTIAPGALAEDTEIEISAVPESEWPEELVGLEDLQVAGDFLRLSPDGLEFAEPAILSRRVDEIAEISDSEVTTRAVAVLSRSGGGWEILEPTIVIDEDGAAIETPLEHFSDILAIDDYSPPNELRGHSDDVRILVTVRLLPKNARRPVGSGFSASLPVILDAGVIDSKGWIVSFGVRTPEILARVEPSVFRVQLAPAPDAGGTPAPDPGDADSRQVIAPFGSGSPTSFAGSYTCIAVGNGTFSAVFRFFMRPRSEFDVLMRRLLTGLDPDAVWDGPPILFRGVVVGEAECFDPEAEHLTAGVVTVESAVKSDPAGHECCVPRPPRKARMTLGSLWFTDAKLGNWSDWQGLFFDPAPGSADDVMAAANDAAVSPPNSLEVVFADDFADSGRFVVEGAGTVAGFANIGVRLEAVAADAGNWSGTLTKGTNGGLPTGQPIVYDISGSLIAPEPIAFVDDLAAAFREGDSQFLLDHLHPDVLELYGGACVEFTDELSSPDLDIAVHSLVEVLDWTVALDGNEFVIPDALRLDVTRTENGEANRTLMHIAARPRDGLPTEMTWFADCGDPFPVVR